MATADLLVLDAQRAPFGAGPLRGPLADLGQVLADLPGGRPTDWAAERLPLMPGQETRQQCAGVPLLPDGRADVSRAGPAPGPAPQSARPRRQPGQETSRPRTSHHGAANGAARASGPVPSEEDSAIKPGTARSPAGACPRPQDQPVR